MAKSRFDYVRSFEEEDRIMPSVWILMKISLKNFLDLHKILTKEDFFGPKLHKLSIDAAKAVMHEFKIVSFSYGFGSNFYFVLNKDATIYRRRASKCLTNVASLFSAQFNNGLTLHLSSAHDNKIHKYSDQNTLPSIYADGSIYTFPQVQHLMNFLVVEQLQCHHVNLTQTAAYHLSNRGDCEFIPALKSVERMTESEKNELLFTEFAINYNNEPLYRKKGSILIKKLKSETKTQKQSDFQEIFKDFSKKEFWAEDLCCEESISTSVTKLPQKAFRKDCFVHPRQWLIVRIDGKGFSKFSEKHKFTKPNDPRSLRLMNLCAKEVLNHFPNIVLSYGQSDEYSFVFKRYGHLEKEGYSLMTRVASLFSSRFARNWKREFAQELLYPAAFDGRVVFYPTTNILRDYLSWRQADCHINNMYNTCFWLLVNRGGLTRKDAEKRLCGTFSNDKREILTQEFGFDYSKEDPFYSKGSVLYRSADSTNSTITLEHCDIIKEDFWNERPWILGKEISTKYDDDPDLL